MRLVFNFPIVAANIEMSIRETARRSEADKAVCGHVGISELNCRPSRGAQYASFRYKSAGGRKYAIRVWEFIFDVERLFRLNRSTIQTRSFRFRELRVEHDCFRSRYNTADGTVERYSPRHVYSSQIRENVCQLGIRRKERIFFSSGALKSVTNAPDQWSTRAVVRHTADVARVP